MGFLGGDSEAFLRESLHNMARDLSKFLVRLAKDEVPTALGHSPANFNLSYDSAGWSIKPIQDTKDLAGTSSGTSALPGGPPVSVTVILREDGSYETITPSSRLVGSYGITGGQRATGLLRADGRERSSFESATVSGF